MLPFGVIQIEQYRAQQQNAAELYLPRLPLAPKLPSEHKLTKSNREIPDLLSDRLSRRDFANVSTKNMGGLKKKNDAVLAKWAPTSNRKCSTNRSYRKQTTKPFLTWARTHIRPARRGALSLSLPKIAHDFAASESQYTELPRWNPLWNPLWKTRRFLQSDRPLLPGSDQNVESDVTSRKQRTQKFLPGATTTQSRLPKFHKVAQGSDELYN
jgi:hypothetical protein